MSPLVHPALCIVRRSTLCSASITKQLPVRMCCHPSATNPQETDTGHARVNTKTGTQKSSMTALKMGISTGIWTLYISRLRCLRVRPYLLKSLPVLVSQPLVMSRGKHVSWALPQKQVLFDWHVPCRLHGSA